MRNINCFGERERGEREGGRGREGEGGREGAMTCRNKVERERKEKQGVERGGREGERGGRRGNPASTRMLTHTLYIDKPNTITRKCYPQINYPKHNWLFSFFSAIKIISSIVPPLVFISDRDIEHITGSVFNVCLRGVNIAG